MDALHVLLDACPRSYSMLATSMWALIREVGRIAEMAKHVNSNTRGESAHSTNRAYDLLRIVVAKTLYELPDEPCQFDSQFPLLESLCQMTFQVGEAQGCSAIAPLAIVDMLVRLSRDINAPHNGYAIRAVTESLRPNNGLLV